MLRREMVFWLAAAALACAGCSNKPVHETEAEHHVARDVQPDVVHDSTEREGGAVPQTDDAGQERGIEGMSDTSQVESTLKDEKEAASGSELPGRAPQGPAPATDVEFRIQVGDRRTPSGLSISPDGDYALSSGDRLTLWEMSTGRIVRTFGRSGSIFSADSQYALADALSVSPDGKFAVGVRRLRVWELSTGRLVLECEHDVEGLAQMREKDPFCGDPFAVVWDLRTGEVARTLPGHGQTISAAAFAADSQYVITGAYGDAGARVWDLSTGNVVASFVGHRTPVTTIAVAPDGKHAVSGSCMQRRQPRPGQVPELVRGTLCLWELPTCDQVRVFEGALPILECVRFSSDGRRVVAASSVNDSKFQETQERVTIWETATGKLLHSISKEVGCCSPKVGHSIAFSPDLKYALSSAPGHTFKYWDVATGDIVRTFRVFSAAIACIDLGAERDSVLLGIGDGSLGVWDLSQGRMIRTFEGHAAGLRWARLSHDGKSALSVGTEESGQWSGNKQTLKLWNVSTGRLLGTLEESSSGVEAAFSANGEFVLSASNSPPGSDGQLRVWEASTGRLVHSLKGLEDHVGSVAFSPDGNYVLSSSYALLSSWDPCMRLWDLTAGQVIGTFRQQNGSPLAPFAGSGIPSACFSPDGTHALCNYGCKVLKVLKVPSGRLVWELENPGSAKFSPEGKYILNGGDAPRLWEASTGRLVRTLEEGTSVFSPSGKYILTHISGTEAIHVCEVASGRPVQILFSEGYRVVFDCSGRYVLTWCGNVMKIWQMLTGELVSVIEDHDVQYLDPVTFTADTKHVLTASGVAVRLWDILSGRLVYTAALRRGEYLTLQR